MRRIQKKLKEGNSDLIETFIEVQGRPENYEVWVPYSYHGIIGFIDLVVEGGTDISLFKFSKSAKNIEKLVKNFKLEIKIYPKSRNELSKNINSYLVFEDSKKNRKSIFSQEKLLEKQPFDIMFLNMEQEQIESLSELRDSLPRLFQTKKIRLEDEAIQELVTNPSHDQIESAILNLEDPPEVITKKFVRKTERYIERNNEFPHKTANLRKEADGTHTKSYTGRSRENDVKAKHS
ncbi:hypothetical protein AKJ51_01990 [candidate division MSBL1 archaeon SCGC-AAA382A20]|uniref:Uncharacterized protein n=1 Tax=candidate division MSBL1 archaeon SCGC-AAA382A20 TaxID=1698280 RepID=A0A133VL00_9EURY|nr:hypothetical protein AKJ51_01990 [candidate division MSBL1 archaeon SCGC-AAA382A20]